MEHYAYSHPKWAPLSGIQMQRHTWQEVGQEHLYCMFLLHSIWYFSGVLINKLLIHSKSVTCGTGWKKTFFVYTFFFVCTIHNHIFRIF